MTQCHTHRPLGFSLGEVTITIAVIGLVAALLMGVYSFNKPKHEDSELQATTTEIMNSVQQFSVDHGLIPKTIKPITVLLQKINITSPSVVLVNQANLPSSCKALVTNSHLNFVQSKFLSKKQTLYVSDDWVNVNNKDTAYILVLSQNGHASITTIDRSGNVNASDIQSSEHIANAGNSSTNSNATLVSTTTQTTHVASSTANIVSPGKTVQVEITFEGSPTTELVTNYHTIPGGRGGYRYATQDVVSTGKDSTVSLGGNDFLIEATGTAKIGNCLKNFTTPALFVCQLPLNQPLSVDITSNQSDLHTTVTILPTTDKLTYELKIKKEFMGLGSVIMDINELYGNLYMVAVGAPFAIRNLKYSMFLPVMSAVQDFVNNIYLAIRDDVNSDYAKQFVYSGDYMGQIHSNAAAAFGFEDGVFTGYISPDAQYMSCIKNCVLYSTGNPVTAGVYVYNNPSNPSDPKNGTVYKGTTVWNSPIKVSLQPTNAALNSDDYFNFDVDGFKHHAMAAIKTPGGLNAQEAWLVYDRHHNGIWEDNTLDNDDVFGDHQGKFKNGYEDLATTFKHQVKYDGQKNPYIELKRVSLWDYLGYVWQRWFQGAKPDASIELKLLNKNHKLMPARFIIQKLYLNYTNVREIDKANTNAIFQRAMVQYTNGKQAQSADQWFNLMLGSYTQLPVPKIKESK